ncbi:MAG: class I SAM-dependent methyltransferase [Hyphomicrobiaceae bacterium]
MSKPFRPILSHPNSPGPSIPPIQDQQRRVLDAGAGPPNSSRVHAAFAGWKVVRQDINPEVKPDILGSITDLRGTVADASFDAVWSSHNIEHLYTHEVSMALSEIKRILKPDGFALITCPDLEQIGKLIAGGDIERTIYNSPAGPISVVDMLFGHTASISKGNTYMAHNTGFTLSRLGGALQKAGFAESWVAAGPSIDLWAAALMPKTDTAQLRALLEKTDQKYLAIA